MLKRLLLVAALLLGLAAVTTPGMAGYPEPACFPCVAVSD